MLRVGKAILFVAMLVALGAAWHGQLELQWGPAREHGAWVLLGGIAVLALARLLAGRIAAPAGPVVEEAGAFPAPGWQEWVAVAAACGLGILFRVLYLGEVPAGMNHDAAWNGMYAIHITQGAPFAPYVSAAWGRETLFMYVIAGLLPWMGNTPAPVHVAATICGVAALLPLYFLARALFGRRVALVALAFFAVSGWHWVFSRVGWRCILVPPFEIIALFGFWRGLRTGAARYWLLTGLGAALSINAYNAGRIIPPIIAVLFALFFLLELHRWKERLKGAVVALFAFLVVGGPMLWYASTHWVQFQGRAAHLMQRRNRETSLLANLTDAAAMFNYRGNGNDFFVKEPLLEPLAATFFVFGFALMVGRPRQREHLFVLLGLLLSLIPGILALPNGNRCIAAMPYVYLIAAFGFAGFADGCTRLIAPGLLRRGAAGLLLLLAVAAASVETYRQFLGPERRRMIGFSPPATAAGEFMHGYGEDYRRYVIAERWPQYTLTYLGYTHGYPLEPHYRMGRGLSEIEDEINRFGRKGLLFVTDLQPAGRDALGRLQRMFAEYEVLPVQARWAADRVVARALIVQPRSASRTGLWSNSSRVLRVHGGGPRAAGRRCFAPVGDAGGVSARLRVMLPEVGDPYPVGEIDFLDRCRGGASDRVLFAVAIAPRGLELRADGSQLLVPWDKLEAGRWYEVTALLTADGMLRGAVDGQSARAAPLRVAVAEPARIAAIALAAEHADQPRGQFFVDDLKVVAGALALQDRRWRGNARRRRSTAAFAEDFETTRFGSLAALSGWRDLEGALTTVTAPGGASGAAAGDEGENAFDSKRGKGEGFFDEPMGVALDSEGNIYVTERANNRVQKFTADGTYIGGWGQLGDRAGQFREPHDIAADGDFLYVMDTWNHRVQAFDGNGNSAFQIRLQGLSSPRGIFVRDGRIYVANSGGGNVMVFDRSGQLLQVLGGTADAQLLEPVDVVVDSRGRAYVVNSGHNRLDVFSADGTRSGAIPVRGWTGKGLKQHYLAIDADDTIYLTDWGAGRVRRFRPDGSELDPVGPRVRRPSGLAVGSGRVIVAVRGENRLLAHSLPGVAPPAR